MFQEVITGITVIFFIVFLLFIYIGKWQHEIKSLLLSLSFALLFLISLSILTFISSDTKTGVQASIFLGWLYGFIVYFFTLKHAMNSSIFKSIKHKDIESYINNSDDVFFPKFLKILGRSLAIFMLLFVIMAFIIE